jgi:hypothetical protein
MNILKRLFNWIQSGPVDFSYVTGEWGFQKGKNGPGPYGRDLQEPNVPSIPATLPTQVAAASAGENIAARVAQPVTNGVKPLPEPAYASLEQHDPVLAEFFSPTAVQAANEQDAYAHIHAER